MVWIVSLAGFVWTAGALLSPRRSVWIPALVVAQTALIWFASVICIRRVRRGSLSSGPDVMPVFAAHVLLYYSAANLIPALFPDLRARPLWLMRFPLASEWAFVVSTLAAGLFLLGALLGNEAASRAWSWPPKGHRRADSSAPAWLPGYRLSLMSSATLLVLVGIGSSVYGWQWDTTLTEEYVAGMPWYEQVFFHGLLPFLPVSPLLAAAAVIQAKSRAQKTAAMAMLLLSGVAILGLLMLWRMRTNAILAMVLPMLLFAYTQRVSWRRFWVAGALLATAAYVSITFVRMSDLPLLFTSGDPGRQQMGDLLSAAGSRSRMGGFGDTILVDSSYRLAALEPVSALVEAQEGGSLQLQWGHTTASGFLQSLPAQLRPADGLPGRLKTAPSHFGVFTAGDWVASPLAEAVIDFGPWLAWLPGIFVGFLLTIIDRVLLDVGRWRAFAGLRVCRLAWFVGILQFEVSLADRTLTFFKATIGYVALFLALGFLARLRYSTSARAPLSFESKQLTDRG
jgi:hypothetical protein